VSSPQKSEVVEILSWVKSLGINEQGLVFLDQYISSSKVLSQLMATRKAMAEDERPMVVEGFPTHLLLMTLDGDRLRCYLTVVAYVDELKDLSTTLKGFASTRGLVLDEVSKEVMKVLQGMDFSTSTLIHEIFCQGSPAIPAKPKQFKFKVKPFSKNPHYLEDEAERMNFRDRNNFQNVVADQLVAIETAATKGIPGRDVFGNQISASSASSNQVIRVGPGIRYSEGEGYYFSESAGMIRFEGNKLWLDTVYDIKGDVDLEVGNINFVGDVKIGGDILSDFTVQAGKGIEVEGSVSGAVLISQEDVRLLGGMVGRGKGRVRTEKSLYAKFINDSIAEAAEDIHISNEALNSRVGALGKIVAGEAVVIGGKLVSLGSMRVGTLGSEMGVNTEVFMGEDFRTLNRSEQIRASLMRLQEVVERRQEELDETITFWQIDRTKEKRDLKNMEDLHARLEDFREQLEQYRTARQEFELLHQKPTPHHSPTCWVERMVYPGTVFYCSGDIYRVTRPLKGPILFQGVTSPEGHLFIKVDAE